MCPPGDTKIGCSVAIMEAYSKIVTGLAILVSGVVILGRPGPV